MHVRCRHDQVHYHIGNPTVAPRSSLVLLQIEYIERLSEVCTVIPLIAKSDSMTTLEIIDFRKLIVGADESDMRQTQMANVVRSLDALPRNAIASALKAYGQTNYKELTDAALRKKLAEVMMTKSAADPSLDIKRKQKLADRFYKFSASVRKRYRNKFGYNLPEDGLYSIIASPIDNLQAFKDTYGAEALSWAVRDYVHGSAQVFNPSHSDTFALRMAVFELGFFELNAQTDKLYDKWTKAYHEDGVTVEATKAQGNKTSQHTSAPAGSKLSPADSEL